MEMKVDIFECDDCHFVFGADETNREVTCCPSCQETNITGVGAGIIKDISKH